MTTPILEHFSAKSLRPPRDFEQPGPELYGKPQGLWVSVRGDNDWLEWCRAESFNLDKGFACRTIVHLAPGANILWITNVAEIDAFDAEFSKADPAFSSISDGFCRDGIDWSAVAERYDGIVIVPYLWQRRLGEKCRWYYGWDCASGCIWRARAIERLEEIEAPTFEEAEAA